MDRGTARWASLCPRSWARSKARSEPPRPPAGRGACVTASHQVERLARLPQHSEPAGHGQSSALLGPPLCCCSPSLLLALGPQLPSHSPLPTVPSYTSASTTSLGSRSLLAFIHLRDPSVCASVPRSLGASCLRVSVPQGPLSSGPPGAAQPLP